MTLVDFAHAAYPSQYRCAGCDVALRPVLRGFVDGSGSAFCPDGMSVHVVVEFRPPAPVVAPSPLLRAVWR